MGRTHHNVDVAVLEVKLLRKKGRRREEEGKKKGRRREEEGKKKGRRREEEGKKEADQNSNSNLGVCGSDLGQVWRVAYTEGKGRHAQKVVLLVYQCDFKQVLELLGSPSEG